MGHSRLSHEQGLFSDVCGLKGAWRRLLDFWGVLHPAYCECERAPLLSAVAGSAACMPVLRRSGRLCRTANGASLAHDDCPPPVESRSILVLRCGIMRHGV